MWEPSTFEDRLLEKHFDKNSGTAYLEVPISIATGAARARRIDAVLIPDGPDFVYQQGDYWVDEAADAIRGQVVYVIEAKRSLNRGVIGQVMVAKDLIEDAMEPSRVVMSVVYARDNADLACYCDRHEIECHRYAVQGASPISELVNEGRADRRRIPDERRRAAFLGGWSQAVNGQLFGSISSKKTHANMGNLFGWIYGDMPEEFRLETWRRYVENAVPGSTDEEAED
ncbi:MAG: hypothetical protein ACOC6F_01100 [bacterium]